MDKFTSKISSFLKDPFGTTKPVANMSMANPTNMSLASQTKPISSPANTFKTTSNSQNLLGMIGQPKPVSVAPSTGISNTSSTVTKAQNQVLGTPVTVSQLSQPYQQPPVQQNMPTYSSLGSTPTYDSTAPTTTATTATTGRDDVLKRILALSESQGNQGVRQQELEKEFALQAKQEKLNQLNARALTVDREYENKRRSIMENPEGKLTGGLQGEIKNLDTQRDQQLADIGIQQAVAQGDVSLATSRIKTRIDSEFEPIKQQVEGLKSYLSLYNDNLSTKDKLELEGAIKRQEATYESGIKNAEAQQGATVWQQLLDNGQVTIKDIPQAVIPYMTAGTVAKYTEEEVAPLRQKITSISGLISGVDGSGAVGPNPLARTSLSSWATGTRQNFVAGVKQLTSQETMNSLLELKKAGGTLGALSDGERVMLQQSATKIGGWEMKDANGNGTGFYNANEKDFKAELQKLQGLAEKAMLNADIVPLAEKAQIVGNKINRDNPTWSEEAKREALRVQMQQYAPKQSFKQVGGDTKIASLANALATIESGGNYKAVSPTNRSGEKAYGKYQILASNIPSWSKEALGQSVTLNEFINNPAIQDQVAQYQISKIYDKYGNTDDVASVWFSGQPFKGNTRSDVTGTNVPKYVQNFRKALNNA